MYQVLLTDDFRDDCANVPKRGRTDYDRVKSAVYSMKSQPISGSKFLTGNLKGKRSKRIGNIRMVFAVCHECHNNGHLMYNGCAICPEITDLNTVIMFAVKDRKEVYEV